MQAVAERLEYLERIGGENREPAPGAPDAATPNHELETGKAP